MLGILMLFSASTVPPATEEKFLIGPADMNIPCHLKIEGGAPREEPPEICAKAIADATTAKEKAILYFAWAYSLNEANASLQTLPNLDKAVALAPNFANARHERSYTLNALGFYDRALIDSDRDVELSPNAAPPYIERAFARHRLADFEGALADRLKAMELGGSHHDAQMAVIDELMWLGRYEEAAKRLDALPETEQARPIRAELERRRTFRPDGNEAKRCDFAQSVDDRAMARQLVDVCTWAFDHERVPAKRADFLTVRATMNVVAMQQQSANLTDLQMAVALDPRNPQRRINYGNALLSVRHSWAAHNEFDLALASPRLSKRDKAIALSGRGQAKFNRGDVAGAKADAKASFEAEPIEPNLWLIGDLAFEDGDKDSAKQTWMMLYRRGSRDDRLIERLKTVGIDDPEKEPK